MSHLITIQSYRSGIGKSTIATNIAVQLAAAGRRVLLIDINFTNPALHAFFGLDGSELNHTLNHYLQQECVLQDTVYNLTGRLRLGANIAGICHLIPASRSAAIEASLAEDSSLLDRFSHDLVNLIDISVYDFIIFDTSAGIEKIQMFLMAMCHTMLAIMHPGQQDYQGTSVILGIAKELEMPTIAVIANEIPRSFKMSAISTQIAQTYECDESYGLPYAGEIMALGGSGIFALRHPEHDLTKRFQQIADSLWVD